MLWNQKYYDEFWRNASNTNENRILNMYMQATFAQQVRAIGAFRVVNYCHGKIVVLKI